jgi:signal transduction histidine kinase
MEERDRARAALRRENSELARQIDAVRRIAVSLSAATEPEELVEEALSTTLALCHAEAGSILLYQADRQKLVFAHVIGEKAPELTGLAIGADQGIAGAVFQSGETLVTEDAASERAHLREVGERVGYVTHSMVTVPLASPGDRPLGVMQVLNKRGDPFDRSDVRLIETVAAQIALAITTMRLHQEARLAVLMRFIGNIGHDVKNMVTPASVGAQTLQLVADASFQAFDACLGRGAGLADGGTALAETMTKLRKVYPDIVRMTLESSRAIQQRMAEIAAAVKGVVSEPHFEPTDIAAVGQRVHTMLGPQAQSKGVTLRIDAAGNLPAVMVDAGQLYSAVYNLIFNAVEACRDGDSVILRCRACSDGDFPNGNYLLLECADTGPGMPDHVKARLFTDEAISTKPTGTGLGTRIIKNVVDAHGGILNLESELGVGTTISCRFPLGR